MIAFIRNTVEELRYLRRWARHGDEYTAALKQGRVCASCRQINPYDLRQNPECVRCGAVLGAVSIAP